MRTHDRRPSGGITVAETPFGVARDSMRNNLPERYRLPLDHWFEARVGSLLRPGMAILDVGSGRCPSVPVEDRPEGVTYVGLDVSRHELDLAPPGSYDDDHVADITRPVAELDGRFDLIVSFQVLEHVKPLAAAFENMHRYLRPGGVMLVQMSGRFSPHGVVSTLLPDRLGRSALLKFTNRRAELVFPAYYDDCWASRMERLLLAWTAVRIDPIFRGGKYLNRWKPVRAAYLLAEEAACRRGMRNLASYYLVEACR